MASTSPTASEPEPPAADSSAAGLDPVRVCVGLGLVVIAATLTKPVYLILIVGLAAGLGLAAHLRGCAGAALLPVLLIGACSWEQAGGLMLSGGDDRVISWAQTNLPLVRAFDARVPGALHGIGNFKSPRWTHHWYSTGVLSSEGRRFSVRLDFRVSVYYLAGTVSRVTEPSFTVNEIRTQQGPRTTFGNQWSLTPAAWDALFAPGEPSFAERLDAVPHDGAGSALQLDTEAEERAVGD